MSGEAGVWPIGPAAKPANPAPSSSRSSIAWTGISLAFGLPCISTNCARKNSIPSSFARLRTSSCVTRMPPSRPVRDGEHTEWPRAGDPNARLRATLAADRRDTRAPQSLPRARARPAPGGSDVLAFHRALPGYAPTPLRALPGETEALGLGEVWLKDENGRFGLPAFKIAGASWALERLLASRPGVAHDLGRQRGQPRPRGRASRGAARSGGAHLPARRRPARRARRRSPSEGAEVVRVAGVYEDAVAAAAVGDREPGAATLADVAYDEARPGRALGLRRLLDDLRRGRRAGGRALRRRALPDRRRLVRLGRDPLRLPPGTRPPSRSASSLRPPPARRHRSRRAVRWSSTRRGRAWPGSTAPRPRTPPGRCCATASRAAS